MFKSGPKLNNNIKNLVFFNMVPAKRQTYFL
jgi:hypothetical protein